MISLLKRFFIKSDDYADPAIRSAYGILCGVVGIVLNIFLFSFKLIAGIISGSVAVTADAFNNLSDAGSSFVTLIGFKLASQEPDKEHPFGHGRIEYISGLVVSFIIMLMGFELIKSAIDKIINPEEIFTTPLAFIILTISVLVKLYMSFYNRSIGKKINSAAMKATAADSLSDSVATFAVIISMLVTHIFDIKIDGICGLVVALFIFRAGIFSAKETIGPLLGQPPTPEFVKSIHELVMSHSEILGIHDLVVHDYGPGRIMVSLHAEVDEKADLLKTHDLIDNIEKNLCEKCGCTAVIHMDPIAREDEETNFMKNAISTFINETYGQTLNIHDFRMVKGETHTNIIFDVVIPYDKNITEREMKEKIMGFLDNFEKRYFAVITVDRSYTE